MLKAFFEPASIAIVGASDKEGSVGKSLVENLIPQKDTLKIYPINPKKKTVLDLESYPSVSAVPQTPDLAVIATPAKIVPEMLEECGKKGVKSVIVVSAGFKEMGAEGKAREDQMEQTIEKYGMRVIGPNCIGVIRPKSGLNATFTTKVPHPGNVAFISQSGALGSAVLDWAVSRNIGFSAFVSIGSMLDVDYGDLIDYFGADPETKSIIIYMESIGSSLKNARKFMSAARGFARTKPIIVLKPGRFPESSAAAMSHTGSMVGEDSYYDSLFNRAGVVRVEEIEDLFNCAAILNTQYLPEDPRLLLITNAGGPGVLATDTLMSEKGKLAQLSEDTLNQLNQFLPEHWSNANPVDVLGDATPERYAETIKTTLQDAGVGGAVVIYVPTAVTTATDLAKTMINLPKKTHKPLLAAIMGGADADKARQMLFDSGIPSYPFPEEAIKTYSYMYQYERNLQMIYETPEDLSIDMDAPKNYLKMIVRNALKEGKTLLSEEDSKKFLTTYRIHCTVPHLAKTPEVAVVVANDVGYPVVMKIASPDISHKSDVGGVILNLKTSAEVKKAFANMMANVKKVCPDARIEGVSIQRMITDYNYELIVGSKKDPSLGPVIVFGQGGIEAEYHKDVAVGLPPLNQILARRMLEGTKAFKMLAEGFRSKPAVNLRLLDEILVRTSNLIIDFPEIKELDINPVVITDNEAVALDGRIVLDEKAALQPMAEHSHLIISPYPSKYVQPWICRDGRVVTLRPIRPEDELMEYEMITNLSKESIKFRFFQELGQIDHDMLTRFCNIDYEREMAFIAEHSTGGKKKMVAVGRLIKNTEGDIGEYAILVAEEFARVGLGLKISDMLIGVAREWSLKSIYAVALKNNLNMLNLGRKLGFTTSYTDDGDVKLTLNLE